MTSSVKTRPFGYLRRLGRIERQHVGQRALVVDGLDGFLARVVAGVAQLMDEHVDPPFPVVDRLAGVVLLFGVVGVEEAADRRMAGAVDVQRARRRGAGCSGPRS